MNEADKKTKRRIVRLMAEGRYGRAARVFHKWKGTPPRFWKDPAKRQEWIRRNL